MARGHHGARMFVAAGYALDAGHAMPKLGSKAGLLIWPATIPKMVTKMAPKIGIACATLAICCCLALSPAKARPPTVTTSPGYDRALTESRKALQPAPAPDGKIAPRKRSKRAQQRH